jgi:hypothetical protein
MRSGEPFEGDVPPSPWPALDVVDGLERLYEDRVSVGCPSAAAVEEGLRPGQPGGPVPGDRQRRRRSGVGRIISLLRPIALLLLLGAASIAEPVGAPLRGRPASGLTPQEERGRRIYVATVSPSGGEIVAVLGEGVEVEGSAVPCASCHGRDGKGRPEGGVTPTDITWPNLTKPYGVPHASGRRHPPYDEKLMKRSLAMGFDPAGNVLHVAMPLSATAPAAGSAPAAPGSSRSISRAGGSNRREPGLTWSNPEFIEVGWRPPREVGRRRSLRRLKEARGGGLPIRERQRSSRALT